jgi:Uma2 family endonuclease
MMFLEIKRKLFTVGEYHQMAAAGILTEDAHVELIEGEIVEMSPIGVRHAACVNRLTALFSFKFRRRAIVSVQNPIELDEHNEPEPDIAILRYREDYYAAMAPTGEDVLLLIEVSDSTLGYDRTRKLPLYAEAGIPEVWIVNLIDQLVEVYRQPAKNGYQEFFRAAKGKTLTAVSFPEETFPVVELLP